jgi:hypothetical protein
MAKLTTRAREKIPATEFGEPKERKYPMPDKAHAANAKARASQMANKGDMPKATEKKIDAKADKVLGRNADRAADRAVARMSKPKPVR